MLNFYAKVVRAPIAEICITGHSTLRATWLPGQCLRRRCFCSRSSRQLRALRRLSTARWSTPRETTRPVIRLHSSFEPPLRNLSVVVVQIWNPLVVSSLPRSSPPPMAAFALVSGEPSMLHLLVKRLVCLRDFFLIFLFLVCAPSPACAHVRWST